MAAETTQKRADIDIETFRGRLLDEKRIAEETIASTKRAEGTPNDSGEGLNDVDDHAADLGTQLFLREEDMALIKNAQDMVAKIDRALAKIEDGTYGISDVSGQPIPADRLEALPYATLLAGEDES